MLRIALSALSLVFLAGCSSGGETTTGTGGTSSSSSSSSGGGAGGSGGGGDQALVQTDKGPVQGAVSGATRSFLGIPYAAAPVGDLRWKPPQPAAAWTEPRDATKKAAYCPQISALGGAPMAGTSEDCLTVNVWTPAPAPAKAPVMVWIHGGGFTLGSGAEATYDGAALAAATGAVVVTMNYRLGPLGWLAHSALFSEDTKHPSSGMYGLEDQQAALAWAKANAAAFGGDPENITVFGESAGGISTCVHLLAPGSAGLFQRAIIESGPCTVAAGTEKAAEVQGDAFAAALGCTDPTNVLACMRGKSADEVLTALPQKTAVIGPNGASWLPVVDGYVVPDTPANVISGGKFNKVPVLLGSNADEGTIFFALGLTVSSEADFTALMDGMFAGQGAAIAQQYPDTAYGSWQSAAITAVGEGLFNCPTRRTARALTAAGVPVFLYHFTQAPKSLLGDLGAFHSSELPFVFGNAYLGITLDDQQQQLSHTMQGYWGTFATSADPNGGGAPAWPKYDAATDQDLDLDLTITTQTGLKKDACDFWDSLGP